MKNLMTELKKDIWMGLVLMLVSVWGCQGVQVQGSEETRVFLLQARKEAVRH